MENNFNPYITPQSNSQRVMKTPNYFELFAFGFAIASIFSCSIIYMAYMFAGFAILFAILSRGAQMQFSPRAKRAILIGIGGIVLSTVLFVAMFLYLLDLYGSIEGILRAGCEIMGLDFETEFGVLFQ